MAKRTRPQRLRPRPQAGWASVWTRSWNRPDYYVDTVGILAPVGRGSPTGVVCYRHTQFPRAYHDGLFVLDWTFGRIYFFALKADGTSYKTEPELFLEPIGTHGFAPNDAVVAPDGSLFVSVGGRKTRGAVFRVQYGETRTDPKAPLRNRRVEAAAEAGPDSLESVLKSPQPLDAWSRAQWMPQAQRLGAQPFKLAVVNDRLAPTQRVRAIEVMTEMFGGLETARAMVAARSHSPQVRARVAWSVGRVPCEDLGLVLLPLAKDNHPGVRRSALESLADRVKQVESDDLLSVLPSNLGHPDKRLRQAAARLAKLLPAAAWKKLLARVENASLQTQLTATLAGIWRAPAVPIHPEALSKLSLLLPKTGEAELRLEVVRLVMLALGDYHLQNPSTEVYTAYEFPQAGPVEDAALRRIRQNLRDSFPSGEAALDVETARLLGMLDDDSPELLDKLISFFTSGSSPTSDIFKDWNRPNRNSCKPAWRFWRNGRATRVPSI